MESDFDKQKRIAPHHRKFPTAALLLVLAVGLCLIFREMIFSTLGFPMPCQGTIFYPLLLLTHYPPLQILLWASVPILFLGLLILALSRRVNVFLVLTAFLAGSGILMSVWTDSGPPRSLISGDTYAQDGLLYRLVYVSGEGVSIENERYPIRTFVLLQCDGLGYGRCDTIGTADMTVGGMQSLSEAKVASARLYLDVTHSMLVLQMGEGMDRENMRSFIGCMLF
jgi:hypothetical protein